MSALAIIQPGHGRHKAGGLSKPFLQDVPEAGLEAQGTGVTVVKATLSGEAARFRPGPASGPGHEREIMQLQNEIDRLRGLIEMAAWDLKTARAEDKARRLRRRGVASSDPVSL